MRRIILTCALVATCVTSAMAESTADKKKAFLKTVDESISGSRIAGNPFKFVGKHVDLHCTVGPIVDLHVFNAVCGDESENALAVFTSSTKDLEQGQSVRILGIVEDPAEGTNLNGGGQKWGTVKAIYME